MKLTVYHDGQFWVGVVEEYGKGKVMAGRYVFGAEPNDQEILAFVLQQIDAVTSRLSQAVEQGRAAGERRVNPKRLSRQVAREMERKGVSSYAQEAIQREYEQRKKERQTSTRQQKEMHKERLREIKRQKAKAKHRGK